MMVGTKVYMNGCTVIDAVTGNKATWSGVVYVLDANAMGSLIKNR